MQTIHYGADGMLQWVSRSALQEFSPHVDAAQQLLQSRTGPGNAFLGWMDLPQTMDDSAISRISEVAKRIAAEAEVLICIGIGGSYLGTKAALEFLRGSFEDHVKVRVLYAGHHINSDYLKELLAVIENKSVFVNVISKSGTTTEPALAFRIIRQWMEKVYGPRKASNRIIATTDPREGSLRAFATQQGYATFDIPASVGGRYSILSAVGLLPIAAAGFDIGQLIAGAREAEPFCSGSDLEHNIAGRYAAMRNLLLRQGKTIEVLATMAPQFHSIGEWWKQLAGESEGKDRSGIFPASVDYTTDLHSLGQWMQEGMRTVFETFLTLEKTRSTITIPENADDSDELNYLSGKSLEYVNAQAQRATLLAHRDGNVPVSVIRVEDRSEYALGQLLYFFQKAVAISGYLLRVNPFNQPGVTAYKENMFGLLGKQGYEKKTAALTKRLEELHL
ncbi:MAG: glucose-6-phosphate isomerase [Chitinivibrionales bacterium]|nr:glucose-6-phosphate isomerase [Chitinivibrionales bacterium]